MARFRSSLSYHGKAASPPLITNIKASSVGGELESTWNELKNGGWLERAFTELVFSDSTSDEKAASRKVDELWKEAVLASALSSVQHADVGTNNPHGLRLRDSPEKANEV